VALSFFLIFIFSAFTRSTFAPIVKEVNILYVIQVLVFVCLMLFNTTFNNISVISLWLVLLVEETGGPVENHRPVASH